MKASDWSGVDIKCHDLRFFRQWQHDIEKPEVMVEKVAALLDEHFPDGPAEACRAQREFNRFNKALCATQSEHLRPNERAWEWMMFYREVERMRAGYQERGLHPAALGEVDFTRARALTVKGRMETWLRDRQLAR